MTPAALAAQDRQDPRLPTMHARKYQLEIFDRGNWRAYGELAILPDAAYLVGRKLENFRTLTATNSITFGSGAANCHQARLYFSANGEACTGTLSVPGAVAVAARGHLTEQTFSTVRAPRGSEDFTAWKTLTYGTDFVGTGSDQRVQSFFRLGPDDISDRTAVSDISAGKTSIEMVPSALLLGPQDKFDIAVAIDAGSFSGTYTDEQGHVFNWRGTATLASLAARTPAPMHYLAHANELSLVGNPAAGSDLKIDDLLAVSSIYATEVKGETKVLDRAQVRTGRYFQANLINALDENWRDTFFGGKVAVSDAVEKIRTDHGAFYAPTAVMNLGQMLHDAFKDVDTERAAIAKIDVGKLAEAWKGLGKSNDYSQQCAPLYIEGYRDGVPDIQPFLNDNPKQWAVRLHDFLTSEQHLTQFSIQVASEQFKHVREQMYEWHTQILVLDPDNRAAAEDVLTQNFGVVVAAQFNQLKWTEDMKPFLAEVIENMLHGDAAGIFDDPLRKQELQNIQETLKEMAGTYDNVLKFADNLFVAFQANKLKNERLADQGEAVYHAMADENPTRWQRFQNAKGPEAIAAIAYGVGAAFLLYNLISGGESATTPKDIVTEVNLGLLALGAVLGGVEKLMATRLGTWFTAPAADGATRLTRAAKNMGKWFTEDGIVIDNKVARAILTKSAGEFMAKRLGPALALVGIALAAWSLADDIQAGDVRDTVFDAINTAFSLADAVFLGIEMVGLATEPFGLVVAAVGLIVGLIQMLWDMFSPPQPPPDPVQQFVSGPLTAAGFVTP
jgi:hypothetical protein